MDRQNLWILDTLRFNLAIVYTSRLREFLILSTFGAFVAFCQFLGIPFRLFRVSAGKNNVLSGVF